MDEDDQQPDAAAEAFEGVRGELARQSDEIALLRRAIEGIAAGRDDRAEQPDYSQTLGRMQKGIDVVAERIAVIHDVLGRSPALNVTPETMTQRIAAAGSGARREDQAVLAGARKGLEDATRALQGVTASARRSEEQNRLLMWVAIGGTVAGMILWAVVAGIVARAVPAGWQWPERMAARALAMPMWEGGQRMMRIASPAAFASIAAGDRIVTANREVLEACRKRANKAHKEERCSIHVGPEM